MKLLELILRLIDELITALKFKKAQDKKDELEKSPYDFFTNHFGNGRVLPKDDTADKADITNKS